MDTKRPGNRAQRKVPDSPRTGTAPSAAVTVRTLSGRAIPPPPQLSSPNKRLAADDLSHQAQWLIEQVHAEAGFRGDKDAQARFKHLSAQHFSSADAGECCLYLFGQVYPEFDPVTGELLRGR